MVECVRDWGKTKFANSTEATSALAALAPGGDWAGPHLREIQRELGISAASFAASALAAPDVMAREISLIQKRVQAVLAELAPRTSPPVARPPTKYGRRRKTRPGTKPTEKAAFTCRHILDGTRPILLVARADGDWQFLCGFQHVASEGRVIGLDHPFEIDPTIRELADLRPQWEAERSAVGAPWRRTRIR